MTNINLYNFIEDFRVMFRFSHTSTFELIPSCLGFPGALVTSGGEYGLFELGELVVNLQSPSYDVCCESMCSTLRPELMMHVELMQRRID